MLLTTEGKLDVEDAKNEFFVRLKALGLFSAWEAGSSSRLWGGVKTQDLWWGWSIRLSFYLQVPQLGSPQVAETGFGVERHGEFSKWSMAAGDPKVTPFFIFWSALGLPPGGKRRAMKRNRELESIVI